MALYSTRKKQRELAEREAQGESFWTETFDQAFRHKILNYIDFTIEWKFQVFEEARKELLLELGKPTLCEKNRGWAVPDEYDVKTYFEEAPDIHVPDVIEAITSAMKSHYGGYLNSPYIEFVNFVKKLLAEHRISFDLVNGQMVEKKSQELHTEVVEPALMLLAGRPEFRDVELAYQDALGELSDQKPADALTDAGTALQAMLTQLGCARKTLGEQIKEAKDKGLFAGRDTPLLSSITGLLQWVAGERNQRSDAHNVVDVPLSEGWLMVHVVGAIIVMLAQTHEQKPAKKLI